MAPGSVNASAARRRGRLTGRPVREGPTAGPGGRGRCANRSLISKALAVSCLIAVLALCTVGATFSSTGAAPWHVPPPAVELTLDQGHHPQSPDVAWCQRCEDDDPRPCEPLPAHEAAQQTSPHTETRAGLGCGPPPDLSARSRTPDTPRVIGAPHPAPDLHLLQRLRV